MTIVRTATCVDDVQDALHEASRTATPLRFRGAGTWLSGGGPFTDAPVLDLRALSEVIEYVPGDLVITVGAGMSLLALRDLTAAHGQMFALDPYGDPAATIGACLATAATAPLAPSDVELRDLVLGLDTVLGTGERTRAGGRVVKNVAGFDLVRLHTGAWGTLGAITAVSLRLHARAACDEALWAPCPMPVSDAAFVPFVERLVANTAPLPMLLVIRPEQPPHLVARVSGNAARVAALSARVAAFGVAPMTAQPLDETLALLRRTPAEGVVLRLRAPRRDAPQLIQTAQRLLPHATLLVNPARGSVRVLLPASGAETIHDTLATLHTDPSCAMIRCTIDQGRSSTVPRTPLEQRIKRAFDPHDLCNRLRTADPASHRELR